MMLFCNFSGLLAARDVLDKSALYSGSRLFVLRAWQPQAAMPAAQNPLRTTEGGEES